MTSNTYLELLSHLNTLSVIDTHEHLPGRAIDRETPTDFLRDAMNHYLRDDLMSAGITQEVMDQIVGLDTPLSKRWAIAEPFFKDCAHTGYGRSFLLTVKELYGVDEVSCDNIDEIDRKFQKTLNPGHFHWFLKEKCNIKVSILDGIPEYDDDLFRVVGRMDVFVLPKTNEEVRFIENESGIKICEFEDWLKAAEIILDKLINEHKIVGLKSALAYFRSLKFNRVPKWKAEDEFQELFSRRHYPDWWPGTYSIGQNFQDYMMYYVLKLANERGLSYQFHTGHFAGTGNFLDHGNPVHLSDFLFSFPDIKFIFFHIGYPYHQQLTSLVKSYRNAYVDMCWGHIISPPAAIACLEEWMETIPINKISGFGGDSATVDYVYGHLCIARENMARALTSCIDKGLFDMDRAKEIAGKLLYDNPKEILQLKDLD